MFIKCLTVGPVQTNCYILCDRVLGVAAVIDPGSDAPRIAAALADTQCAAQFVLLTHAHYDHIAAVHELLQKTGAALGVLKEELPLLNDPVRNLFTSFEDAPFRPFEPELAFADGDTVSLGKLELRVIATPGHTAGSCCYLCQDVLFSGDTLFCENIGRTDLPTGSSGALLASVRRLAALEGEIRVFPGHGEMTTLSHERQFNPFLSGGDEPR